MTQMLKCTLFEDSREEVEPRLGQAVRRLHRLYSVFCSRGGLLRESLTLANLVNGHVFISKKYISTGTRRSKQRHESLCLLL